jgi:hypothetical protein
MLKNQLNIFSLTVTLQHADGLRWVSLGMRWVSGGQIGFCSTFLHGNFYDWCLVYLE